VEEGSFDAMSLEFRALEKRCSKKRFLGRERGGGKRPSKIEHGVGKATNKSRKGSETERRARVRVRL